jgi:hypothetical protein
VNAGTRLWLLRLFSPGNALDRAAADAELLGNLVQAGPARSRQSERQDAPFQLGVDKGPTAVLVTALARAMLALTRSRIMARSNSANTPIIWNMALEVVQGRRRRLALAQLRPGPPPSPGALAFGRRGIERRRVAVRAQVWRRLAADRKKPPEKSLPANPDPPIGKSVE